MSKRAQRQGKEDWDTLNKPSNDKLQKKEEFIFIPNDDHELDDMMHNARRKLESISESAMPCKGHSQKTFRIPRKMISHVGGNILQTNRYEFTRKVSMLRPQFMLSKKQRIRHKDLFLKKNKGRKHHGHLAYSGHITTTHYHFVDKSIPLHRKR